MGRLAILFFEQPRLLRLLLGMVTVSGLTASQVLPRMEDPLMKPRAATIRTVFPGASTERVETLVTDVIERELLELEDIRLIRSGSRNGYSLIALELRDEIERRYDIHDVTLSGSSLDFSTSLENPYSEASPSGIRSA